MTDACVDAHCCFVLVQRSSHISLSVFYKVSVMPWPCSAFSYTWEVLYHLVSDVKCWNENLPSVSACKFFQIKFINFWAVGQAEQCVANQGMWCESDSLWPGTWEECNTSARLLCNCFSNPLRRGLVDSK